MNRCPYCDRPYLVVTSDARPVRIEVMHRFNCQITDTENVSFKRQLLALEREGK